jgi:hypothetical protein
VTVISPDSTTEGIALSRELADFLIELAIALNKHAIYPGGHPLLESTTARLARRLAPILIRRQLLVIGVGQGQLIIDDAATDVRTPVLAELAERLRRRDVGAIRIRRGATADELSELLRAIGKDQAALTATAFDPGEYSWRHIDVTPLNYRRIALADQEDEPELEHEGRARRLWVDLARAGLGPEGFAAVGDPEAPDALVVAHAIKRKAGAQQGYHGVVASYLRQISGELKRDGGSETSAMRGRMSTLIGGLEGDSLERLLKAGGADAGLREFILDASQWLAADAVVELVRASANVAGQQISNSMLGLLHKLALHVRLGEGGGEYAEGELRDRVKRLVSEWSLEDPNPEDHRLTLDTLRSEKHDATASEANASCEPERIIQMALELQAFSPAVERAVQECISYAPPGVLIRLADGAPSPEGQEWLWRFLSTTENVRLVLATPPLDTFALDRLVARLGVTAAEPMLDALEWSEERTTRRRLVETLGQLGPGVGPLLAGRLDGAPWFVQRNLLLILGKLSVWPESFSPEAFAGHEDPRVRREAIKLLLGRPDSREQGQRLGLADRDEQVLRITLSASLASCPADLSVLLLRRLESRRLPPELRTLTIRAFAACRTPEGREWLVAQVLIPRRWFRRARLMQKSPELLAGIAGLAAHWPDSPAAREVLDRAAKSRDPEIRAAAGVRT